jgi:hypothetical protein
MRNPLKRTAKADKSAAPDRKAMHAKAAKLLDHFAADTPHEAQSGLYSFCLRDQWYGKKIGVYDGWYSKGEWAVCIAGGMPADAVRSDRLEWPKEATVVL